MRLTIHRGADQIGGSCLEVSTPASCVFFDVGSPLPPLDKSFPMPDPVLPETATRLTGGGGKLADAVFISHAHGDHVGLVNLILQEIPVSMSIESSKMMLAGSVFAGQVKVERKRIRCIKPEERVEVGDIVVTAIAVDHSIPGAFAFLIECAGKRIFYTGDMRMHGQQAGTMRLLGERLNRLRLNALVMEGTRLGQEGMKSQSESELCDDLVGIFESSEGLSLAFFSPQNLERLQSYRHAASRAGRVLVLDPYSLFICHLFCIPISEGVRVWFPRGRSRKDVNVFAKANIDLDLLEIGWEEMRSDPQRYAVVFRNWMAGVVPDLLEVSESAIYSYWRGYEQTQALSDLKSRMEANGINWINAHTSGHLTREGILEFGNQVDPEKIIPIHTERADLFAQYFSEREVIRLQDGEDFMISSEESYGRK